MAGLLTGVGAIATVIHAWADALASVAVVPPTTPAVALPPHARPTPPPVPLAPFQSKTSAMAGVAKLAFAHPLIWALDDRSIALATKTATAQSATVVVTPPAVTDVELAFVPPREALIARSMERDKLPRDEAAKLVDDTNKQREQWVRAHWNRDWRAAENYDVCVNTQALGIEGAAQVIVSVTRDRFHI